MWCHLVNANKTPDRGPQGRDNRARSAINLRPEDGYLQLVHCIIIIIIIIIIIKLPTSGEVN